MLFYSFFKTLCGKEVRGRVGPGGGGGGARARAPPPAPLPPPA